MECNATQENVVEKLKTIHTFSKEVEEYYRYKSKLWRAIRDHIEGKDCILVHKPSDLRMAKYKCQSPVSVEKVEYISQYQLGGTYYTKLVFHIEVDYCFDEIDTLEHDMMADRTETYRLYVDLDLETNFREAAFQQWIEQVAEERKAQAKTEIHDAILNIIKVHGSEAKALLESEDNIKEILEEAKKREKDRWQ